MIIEVPLSIAITTPDGVTVWHVQFPVREPERVVTDLSDASAEELLTELRRRLDETDYAES